MHISLIKTISDQLPVLVDQFEHTTRVGDANFEEIQAIADILSVRSYIEVSLPSSAKTDDGETVSYFMRFNTQGSLLCVLYGCISEDAILVPVIVYARGLLKPIPLGDPPTANA